MASSITFNGKELALHPSGPRGWRPDEANDFFEELAGKVRYSSDVRDLRDFGSSVGTGSETRDTDAFQGLLTDVAGATARVLVPKATSSGGYLLGEPLEYTGSPSYGLHIVGEVGAPARGLTGTVIKWTGDLGGVMTHFRGLNGSVIEGLTFDLNERADCGLWLSEFINADGTGLIGSANIRVQDCYFADNRAVATTDLVRIGLDQVTQGSRQTSEVHFEHCFFFGNFAAPGRSCIHVQTGGNCKNFSARDCMFVAADYGWYQPGASGTTKIDNCQAIAIGYNVDGAGVNIGGAANSVTINDFQMENTNTIGATDCRAKAFDLSSTGENTITGGYYRGRTPADDYGAFFAGPTTMLGFDFEGNDRVGSNVLKVQSSGGCLTAINCYWAWNTTALSNAPLYDSGNNHLIEHENATVTRNDLLVIGGRHSLASATKDGVLPAVVGKPLACTFGAVGTQGVLSSGVASVEDGERYIVTVPYTAVLTAALTNTLNVGRVRALQRIGPAVVAKVTANFTGIAGPVTVEVGHDGDVDGFLLSFTASAGTSTKGIVSADLGVELASATRPHPSGYVVPLATERDLQAKFTSASGNLSGLSGGSVQIIFEHKYLGP